MPASPLMAFFGRGNAGHYLVVAKLDFFERVPRGLSALLDGNYFIGFLSFFVRAIAWVCFFGVLVLQSPCGFGKE